MQYYAFLVKKGITNDYLRQTKFRKTFKKKTQADTINEKDRIMDPFSLISYAKSAF